MDATTSFRCGHPRVPENTVRNGGTATRCKLCHAAKEAARKDADPDAFRAAGRERMRKHLGEPRGHWHGRKTECPQGHPYDEANTYAAPGGGRQCKTCRRDTATAYYHEKRANGGEHSDAEWLELCERHGRRCLRCGLDAPLTRDHVVPVSLGGSNAIENIQPLCRPCNAAKKDKHIDYRPLAAVAV